MTMAGNLPTPAKNRRNKVENVLSDLELCMDLLIEIDLRTRQAIRRTNLVVSVLDPSIERIKFVQLHIVNIQRMMRDLWRDGQGRRWSDEDPYDE